MDCELCNNCKTQPCICAEYEANSFGHINLNRGESYKSINYIIEQQKRSAINLYPTNILE